MSANREWSIYVLKDPGTNAVRYVGWSHNVPARVAKHLLTKEKCHRGCWIRSLLKAGKSPALEVIEKGFGPAWADAERRWIKHYREAGARLTNSTDGGEGTLGYRFSAEQRERHSDVISRVPRTKEWSAKIGLRHRGKIVTTEAREKLAAAMRGRTLAPGAIAKRSATVVRNADERNPNRRRPDPTRKGKGHPRIKGKPPCVQCGSLNLRSLGPQPGNARRFKCHACGRAFTHRDPATGTWRGKPIRTEEVEQAMAERRKAGATLETIAAEFGWSPPTVCGILKRRAKSSARDVEQALAELTGEMERRGA